MTDEQIKELENWLFSDAGIKTLNEHIEEETRRGMERDYLKKKLTNNTIYIDWAIEYLSKREEKTGKKYFSDDKYFDFDPKKVDETTREEILNLNAFLDAIDDYATSKKIDPTYTERGYHYRVQYKGKIYIVGSYSNPEICTFFKEETETNKDTKAVDFVDLVITSSDPYYIDIKERIESIQGAILTASKDGYKYSEIINTISSSFRIARNEDEDSEFDGSLNSIKNVIIDMIRANLDEGIIEASVYHILEEIKEKELIEQKLLRKKMKATQKKETDN